MLDSNKEWRRRGFSMAEGAAEFLLLSIATVLVTQLVFKWFGIGWFV